MPNFLYTARTAGNTTQTGTVTAQNKAAALESLKAKGLHPLVVKSSEKKGLQMDIKLPGSKGVKPKALVVFTRQFATMISAGVPILKALNTLKEQSDSPTLKIALEQVTSDVEGGMSLSDALTKHPKTFSEIYINMVRAGEEGGILDQILNRLATQVEKDATIKSKFKGAMIYPGVVSIVAVIAVIFLMVGVIPKLTAILVENGGELPPQTKLIIAISDLLITKWPFLLGSLAAILFFFRRWAKTDKGRHMLHRFFLKMPIFGKITMKVNVARFARTFSSLLGAGVSVNEALETTAGALSNVIIRDALLDASKMIRNGHTVSESLAASGILPEIIIQMAAVGEETGQLDTVLNKVAEFYEQEVDTVINSLSSIIEPILIVGLGAVVGFIVASVLGPITALQGSIQ
jgi:type IV pilus assembly protein PilC